jgi:hypothetical protein
MTSESIREFTRQVSMMLAGEERRVQEDAAQATATPTATPDEASQEPPFSLPALKRRAGFIDRNRSEEVQREPKPTGT